MIVETTVNIHRDILTILDRAVRVTGKSRNLIIKHLMQKMLRINQNMLQSCSRIKYQDRDIQENWHKVHIALNEYEYEYCLDMRKFYKRSVSFILADAVRRYLSELLSTLLDKNDTTDNYRYRNYIFIKKTLDGAIYWQIYWGVPHKLSGLLMM